MRSILDRDDLRIVILDLEASGLGPGSYPIEAGLALVSGPARQIRTRSILIRPTPQWRDTGLWSPASAAIHNIPRESLDLEGRPVADVCDWLNLELGPPAIVVTDAPAFDQAWLDTLFQAGNREQQFKLHEFDALTGSLDRDQYRTFVDILDRKVVPHRAGPDALRLAASLMEAHLGRPPTIE